jgi:photosystem II stability/assembly factor-like uncharacterized protein
VAILSSNDRGRTWLKRYEDSASSLTDISCPSVSTCFAVGSNFILSTSDGGGSWTQQLVGGTNFSLMGIDCPTITVCFAVGAMQDASAAVYYTTNGGVTWTLKPSAGPRDLSRISCASIQNCVAVGYWGSAIRTTDGVNWSTGLSPTTQQLFSVDCPSTTACFAGTNTGEIIATTDGGATWSLQSSPAGGFWGVDCITPIRCLAAGDGGSILSTTNGGSNWSAQSSGTSNRLIGVDCPETTVCFVVGYAGTILALPPAPRSEVAQPALPQSTAASRLGPPPVPPPGPGRSPAVTSTTVRPKGPISPAPATKLQAPISPPAFSWLLEALQSAIEQRTPAILRGHHRSNSTRMLL